MEKRFHGELKKKMNLYVHNVYKVTKTFPKDELYGVTSQFRRSSLSVILNYIEGFARQGVRVNKNFLRISYASLKESEYLISFSHDEGYIKDNNYKILAKQADEIGAMLWKTIQYK
ncbi:four helix bundle protein [Patescibacteria group bacterium]|nr:four helix bundle protein [Patescibacteria group bacterium]